MRVKATRGRFFWMRRAEVSENAGYLSLPSFSVRLSVGRAFVGNARLMRAFMSSEGAEALWAVRERHQCRPNRALLLAGFSSEVYNFSYCIKVLLDS